MFSFIAFYRGRTLSVQAATSYEAQQKAAQAFKARKAYEVTVMRADVAHSTASL